MRMSKRQVARALAQARLKAVEEDLKKRKQENEKDNDDERIIKQIEDLEKVLKVMFDGGDSA